MKINKVYAVFFSPTNGTERYVKKIAEGISVEYEIINLTIPEVRNKEYSFKNDDVVILGSPVYGGRIPQIEGGIFNKLKGNNTPAIFNVSFGNRDFDDALLEEKNICEKNGFVGIGAGAWVSKHTFSDKIGADRPNDFDNSLLDEFVSHIKNTLEKEEWKDKKLTVSGKYPYKKYVSMPFTPKPTDICTKCNLCASKCPTGAIDKSNPNIIDKKKCISCFACIKNCPINARKVNNILYKATSPMLEKMLKKEQSSRVFYL